jgi:hypothetical protein
MRRRTRHPLLPWLLVTTAFAACNAITGVDDLEVGGAGGGTAGEGAGGEGAGGEGAAGEGTGGRGAAGEGAAGDGAAGGNGGGPGDGCGAASNCEACCADREGLALADIGRDYFRACFCDSLNNSGSGELCDNASGECAGCCGDLCDSGGTRPSPEQLDRCSLCAFRQSGNQGQCRDVIEYSCFSRGLASCSLRTCASNECGP